MGRADTRSKSNETGEMTKIIKNYNEQMGILVQTVCSLEKKMEKTNDRIDRLTRILTKNQKTEQLGHFRAMAEEVEQPFNIRQVEKIKGRHRQILSLLINDGLHSYFQMARKLNISESRARAYVTELKSKYKVPIRRVREPEGFKIGIDMKVIGHIIAQK